MASVTTKSARSLTARSPKRSKAQVTLTTQATVGELIEIPGMDLDALVHLSVFFVHVTVTFGGDGDLLCNLFLVDV